MDESGIDSPSWKVSDLGARAIYYLRFFHPLSLACDFDAICVSNRPVIHCPVTKKPGIYFNDGGLINEPRESDVRLLCRLLKLQLTGRLGSGR